MVPLKTADQALGHEDQLLTAAAQRHARLLAERDHDVCEAVHQVELVDERVRAASRQLAVQRERAPPLGEHAEVALHVEVGAQSVPGEEIAIGLLGLRVAEQELSEVLFPLAGLPTETQPHGPVLRQRDELQPVPEVIRGTQVHPPQDRPVFVEPSGRSDLIHGPLRFARSLAGLSPRRQHAVDEGQPLEDQIDDEGDTQAAGRHGLAEGIHLNLQFGDVESIVRSCV